MTLADALAIPREAFAGEVASFPQVNALMSFCALHFGWRGSLQKMFPPNLQNLDAVLDAWKHIREIAATGPFFGASGEPIVWASEPIDLFPSAQETTFHFRGPTGIRAVEQ